MTSPQPPRVTAVMLTGKTPDREQFAKASMACFMNQTYANKELLIINQGNYTVNKSKAPNVTEVRASAELNHGQMWNVGLDNAKGDWIITWDDDDYHHPQRITMQMAHRAEECCVVLKHRLFVDLTSNAVLVLTDNIGMSGTILHPRIDARYPGLPQHADAAFYTDNFVKKGKAIVLDNRADTWPGAALYMQLWHGGNTSGETNRLRILNDGDTSSINAEHAELISEVLPAFYNIPVQATEVKR